ncbi:MAG: DUF4430 domain-containing protein [Chloroflexi bacterium]|nr:DUF4430 domain-containing protein [Chloroflexota bacterium]
MVKLFRFLGGLLLATTGIISATPALAQAQPDLQPTQITVTTLYAGVTNAVTVVVANNGDAAASNFTVSLSANGTVVGTQTGISVPAKNDPFYWPAWVKFNWNPTTAGNYTLTATADAAGTVTESNETNNQFQRAVTVLAATPVTVKVRVEGKTATVWSGEVTFQTSTITDKQGTPYTIDHPTALGALQRAAQAGGFSFVVSSAYGPLSFIEAVAGEANLGMDGWMYRVNWASPEVAAVDWTLAASDEVLWYYSGATTQPLRLSVDKDNLLASENFTATIESYDGTTWSPVSGAALYAGSRTFTTGANGTLIISLTPGRYTVSASKGDYTQFTRSNQKQIVVYVPLNLQPGWNFISVPKRLVSDNNTAQKVFSGVDTAGHSIFAYSAAGGWTALGTSAVVSPLDSIWIYSATAVELHPVFDADPRQVPPTKQLAAGWNAIGFSDFTSASANSALTSVEARWTTLIGFDAVTQTYEASIINDAPSGDPHSELREMSLWKGYWLYLTSAGELAAISS